MKKHTVSPERLYTQSRLQHLVVNRNRFLANLPKHAYRKPPKLETGYKEISLGEVLRRSFSPLIVEGEEEQPQPVTVVIPPPVPVLALPLSPRASQNVSVLHHSVRPSQNVSVLHHSVRPSQNVSVLHHSVRPSHDVSILNPRSTHQSIASKVSKAPTVRFT